MNPLKIVYMGTPEFAVPGLKLLLEKGYNVVGVITAPDKPKGRGLKSTESPVKEFAKEKGLNILQPEKLKDEGFLVALKNLEADLQIVVAFRMLPEQVWKMPMMGTFNLHASLLPQYRGAAPINWAIINGEKETGVTTFFLKQEIDTGDVILQEKEPIFEEDTAGSLYERLRHKGAGLILKTVEMIESDSVILTMQNDTEITKPAPKIFKEDCKIDWNKAAGEISNFVRGLSPYPSAYCYINDTYCKIFEVKVVELSTLKAGEVQSDGKSFINVGCGSNTISILSMQCEGKKRLTVKEFLAGNKVVKIS